MDSHCLVSFAVEQLNGKACGSFRVALIASACALSACSSMEIASPKHQTDVSTSTVPVVIQFSDAGYSQFSASLDGADRTSSFTLAYEQATASFPLGPGSHTLTASAEVYDTFYRRDIAYNVASTFTVLGPTFTLNSSAPLVLRRNGGSTNLSATISLVRGFSAPVELSIPNPPPGVFAGTTVMPAGSTTGQIAVTATAGASYGDHTVTLRAEGGGVTATTTLTLRVFHAVGPFAKASFGVTTPPQTASSANGIIRVTASLGSAEGLPSAFAAVYERQNGGVGRLGQPIPFNHGQTNVQGQAFGGAGFCAGSLAGFVIAGKGPGVVAATSAQYVASALEFTNPSPVGQADVAAFRSTGTTPYYFEPALYFSSDCTLALAVGAHPIGPENNLAQVIELKSARVVGSAEFSAPSFTAAVVDAGTRQRIEFTSGGQTQNVAIP
jgi:hypothetical protein